MDILFGVIDSARGEDEGIVFDVDVPAHLDTDDKVIEELFAATAEVDPETPGVAVYEALFEELGWPATRVTTHVDDEELDHCLAAGVVGTTAYVEEVDCVVNDAYFDAKRAV